MKIKTYTNIIQLLPDDNERLKLEMYDGTEILDDILDFMQIQFPDWQEELADLGTSFILMHLEYYYEWYADPKGEEYVDRLEIMYTDIQNSYFDWYMDAQYIDGDLGSLQEGHDQNGEAPF